MVYLTSRNLASRINYSESMTCASKRNNSPMRKRASGAKISSNRFNANSKYVSCIHNSTKYKSASINLRAGICEQSMLCIRDKCCELEIELSKRRGSTQF